MIAMRSHYLYLPSLLVLLAACAAHEPPYMQGANFLQSSTVAVDSEAARDSLVRLRRTGANTVAFVTFMRQIAPDSCYISADPYLDAARLGRAIGFAKEVGLRVVLKPQILLPTGWAGDIRMNDEASWQCWFEAYRDHLLGYASLAQEMGVEELLIGTELKNTEQRPEWRSLITSIRRIYYGRISYAVHDMHDLATFVGMPLVDRVSVVAYPSLGDSAEPEAMLLQVNKWTAELASIAKIIGKPIWVAEVGITSRTGAQKDSWVWENATPQPAIPDTALQAEVLGIWLAALVAPWNRGVLIWAWYSDPNAGGLTDTGFTFQNKPAERIIKCKWSGICQQDK